jgi:peroxiredoxin
VPSLDVHQPRATTVIPLAIEMNSVSPNIIPGVDSGPTKYGSQGERIMNTSQNQIRNSRVPSEMLCRAFFALVLGLGLALWSLASFARVPSAISVAISRKAAPAFGLQNANGEPVRLSDYKGRVVLLNFWATWCHGCKTEIPWFIDFQMEYKTRGLAVIGVSMDVEGWKTVKPFIRMKKMNYPVVIGNDDLAKQYGLGSMPMTLLIDRNGKIADSHSGVVDKIATEKEIRMLLREGTDAH